MQYVGKASVEVSLCRVSPGGVVALHGSHFMISGRRIVAASNGGLVSYSCARCPTSRVPAQSSR